MDSGQWLAVRDLGFGAVFPTCHLRPTTYKLGSRDSGATLGPNGVRPPACLCSADLQVGTQIRASKPENRAPLLRFVVVPREEPQTSTGRCEKIGDLAQRRRDSQ